MGMYFDFALACILRADTPQGVLEKLAEITNAAQSWFARSSPDVTRSIHEIIIDDSKAYSQDFLDKLAEMATPQILLDNSLPDAPSTSGNDAVYQLRRWGALPGFPGVFGSALLNAYQYGVAGRLVYRY